MQYKFNEEQIAKIKDIVGKYSIFNQEMTSIKKQIEDYQERLKTIEQEILLVMSEEEKWIITEANTLKITPDEFKALIKQMLQESININQNNK